MGLLVAAGPMLLHTVSADVTGSIEMWELVPGIEGKPLRVGVCMQDIGLCFNVAAPISDSAGPCREAR